MNFTLKLNYIFVFTTVVLSGSSSNADFRGFLIQGRTMNDAATGTFMKNGDNQQIICENVSYYHDFQNPLI